MSDRSYRWYVEPLGSHTNQVIGVKLSADRAQESLKDNRGILRDVWECPDYAFVSFLRRSTADLQLDFAVYTREGEGAIRPATFITSLRKRVRNLTRSLRPHASA